MRALGAIVPWCHRGAISMLAQFVSSFWHHFFENRCCIGFSSYWGWIWVSCLMVVLIHVRFAHATWNTFKTHCCYNELNCFYISDKHDLYDFHNLFRYLFWHCFFYDFKHRCWIHVGTLLALFSSFSRSIR